MGIQRNRMTSPIAYEVRTVPLLCPPNTPPTLPLGVPGELTSNPGHFDSNCCLKESAHPDGFNSAYTEKGKSWLSETPSSLLVAPSSNHAAQAPHALGSQSRPQLWTARHPPPVHTHRHSASVRRCSLLPRPTGKVCFPPQREPTQLRGRCNAEHRADLQRRSLHPPGTGSSGRGGGEWGRWPSPQAPTERGPEPRSRVPSAAGSLPAGTGHAERAAGRGHRGSAAVLPAAKPLRQERPRALRGSSPSPDLRLSRSGGRSPGKKKARADEAGR